MRCPYCGSAVEEGDDICLNCERPLDVTLLREQKEAAQAVKQERVAAEQKIAALVVDPAIEHKAAQVHNPTLYLIWVALALLGLSLVSLLLMVPQLGWQSYYTDFTLAAALVFLLLLLSATLVYLPSKQAIRRMVAGEGQVVHWTYNEQEWQQFTTFAWRRDLKTDGQVTALLVGVVLVIGLVPLVVSQGGPNAWIFAAMLLVLGVCIGLLLVLKDVLIVRVRRRQANAEAYVSRKGVILGGWYGVLSSLSRVEYKAGDPAVLRLFNARLALSAPNFYRRSVNMVEVPVPHGHEAEAEQVVNDLKAKGF